MAFAFYSSFCNCATRKRKIRRKTKKLSQFLKSHISGTREAISFKFGMCSPAVGGHVHSKNRLVSSRKLKATEVRKLRFLSSVTPKSVLGKIGQAGPILVDVIWSGRTSFGIQIWSALTKTGPGWVKCKFAGQM